MIQSERMTMRKLKPEDFTAVRGFLQDDEIMYAWGGGFTEQGVRDYIAKNMRRVEEDGCAFLLAQDTATGEVYGIIGLIYNEDINGTPGWEVAYILKREHWGKGLAREGTTACIEYAYSKLGADRVFVQMRTDNGASERVAKALGLRYLGSYARDYRGEQVQHNIYVAEREANG